MFNPERLNPNPDNSNDPNSTGSSGESHEQLDPERTRRIGRTALERYNLLTPKLEEEQDAHRRNSESLANLYNEMQNGESSRAERIAILEREIESIGFEIDSLQQQLDLARAALDELEGHTPQNPTDEPNPGDNGEAPTSDNAVEDSGENAGKYDHNMVCIETTDGPILVIDNEVQDGRSEEAKRRDPLPPNFAEIAMHAGDDAELGERGPLNSVESVDAVDYNVRQTSNGEEVYEFSDGTRVIGPSLDQVMDETDEAIARRQGTEEWERPVDPAEAEVIDQEVRETSEKMKKPSRFKKWVVGLGIGAALLGGILSGPIGQAFTGNVNADLPQNTQIEQTVNNESTPNDTSYEEMNAIFDYDSAYSLPGLYSSPNKPNAAAFACGDEVDALCENDDIRSAEYVLQVRETMANWIAGHVPDQLKHPDDVGIDSQVQLSERYDSLSNEEFDAVYQHYCDVWEHNVRARRGTITGTFDNAFEFVKDSNGSLNSGNVELGRSVTEEDGTEVIVYTFLDDNGNVIGELTVKQSCRQAVDEQGTNEKSYEGMQERNPDQPQNFDSGNETQGNETQGTETQGNETQGNETQGNETQGTETQGTETQGTETQGTETQGTETQGTETQGTETQGTETQGTESQGEEHQETIAPKDEGNLERTDQNYFDDISDNTGDGDVETSETPSETIDAQTPTEKPAGDDFEGTSPTIVENETSEEAESVTPVTPEDGYSENRGGTHETEYAPVQGNTAAQEAADDGKVSSSEAPSTTEAAGDTLDDLGIN